VTNAVVSGPQAIVTLVPATAAELSASERAGAVPPSGLVWYATSSAEPINLVLGQELVPIDALEKVNRSPLFGVGPRLADAFAKTFRRLGIPVAMAAVVGICLLESGAAARLVAAVIALFGRVGTGPALTVSGFVLGVPVYFDNVFYLLLPLAKSVGRRQPEQYLTAVMAIIVGATMAHSLVPPTPGPLFVAAELGVSIGSMMLGGLVVGGGAACVGYLYGASCHRWIHLRPPELGDSSPMTSESTQSTQSTQPSSELKRISLWLAALPIAFPVAALGGSEILKTLAKLDLHGPQWLAILPTIESVNGWLADLCDPNLVFLVTGLLSIWILRRCTNGDTVGRSVAKGLSDAGIILLLTCAGGAFGAALQQLGLADAIADRFSNLTTPWVILSTAFLLTATIRAAQGSATVSMLTSVGIVAPLIQQIDLPFDPLYVALAIGCGSKPLPWMNDSGFWQVATMTGMNTSQTLKTFTVALTLMGLTGFALTILGAWLFPLR
jgi:GntP family gluconate:H+ symporter